MIKIRGFGGNEFAEDTLIPQINRMRRELKGTSKETLTRKSGAFLDRGRLFIDVFFQRFEIDPDDFSIRDSEGEPVSTISQSIILSYLTTADGEPPSNKLISFRELPDGVLYCHAFQGYAPDRLAKHFQQDIANFSETCRKIGGAPVNIGDAGFRFTVFPKIEITAAYFLGDEMFPSSASFLFDSNVSHYMVTAGLASIGSRLARIITDNGG
ncbi:MAG: DUF3786 domain-containing protein [Desulfobacterales bacterium]|nr:DUF3786 domain-containing protein [Desulfobacterales bacterium]